MRLLIVLLVMIAPAITLAGQGVPAPYVTKGEQILTMDGFHRVDALNEVATRQRLTLDSGATDQLMLRQRILFQDDRNGEFGFEELEVAGIYAFDIEDAWLDSGFYGGIHAREDGSSMWTGRLLLAKQFQPYEFRSNLILRNDFGDPMRDIRPQLRFRLSYTTPEQTSQWAMEYFGRFGTLRNIDSLSNARQQAGPLLTIRPKGQPFYLRFGALAGLNNQTEDWLLKWRLAFMF